MTDRATDELERILCDGEGLRPMTGFSARVLRAVREDAAAKPPLAFPWSRFLPGLVVEVVLLVGAAVWLLLAPGSGSSAPFAGAEWLSDPQIRALVYAALVMVGSGVLAWIVTRLAAPRRRAALV